MELFCVLTLAWQDPRKGTRRGNRPDQETTWSGVIRVSPDETTFDVFRRIYDENTARIQVDGAPPPPGGGFVVRCFQLLPMHPGEIR